MKISFYFSLVVSITSVVWGWTAVEFTDNSVEHPGYCYSKAVNVQAMEKGENRTLEGECVEATCGDDTHVYYKGCDELPENCTLLEKDLSKPYPDCCPIIDQKCT